MSRTLLAAGALVLLLLTACNDDPEPRVADPTSPPTSTTPTSDPPTTTPPTTPDPDPLSPEETVRAWVDGFNTTVTTGRTTALSGLSTAECPQCKEIEMNFGQMYERGGSVQTDGWRIKNLKANPDFDSSGKIVALISSARAEVVQAEGEEAVSEPAERFIVELTLRQVDGVWLVDELSFLS